MSSELQSLDRLMGGVRRSTKQVKLKVRKLKDNKSKKSQVREKTKVKEEESQETADVSPKASKEVSSSKKAYQPMLPGMRGSVTRAPVSKGPKPKSEKPSGPRATQPMLPGMGKPPKSKKVKEEQEDTFIPGGVDWSTKSPVNLNAGRQFNG